MAGDLAAAPGSRAVNAARNPRLASPLAEAVSKANAGTTLAPRPWRRGRWWGLVALVLTVQMGLIFWLGERDPIHPRAAAAAPTLQLPDPAAPEPELVALADPTLFALPHRHGFAGPAWLDAPPPEARAFVWVEPPGREAVELNVQQLGATFQQFIQTNHFAPLRPPAQPRPELQAPVLAGAEVFPQQSTNWITGQLASRRLLTPVEAPSWPVQPPGSELLSNSVVRMIVAADGRPVSLTLLSSSGLKDADDFALAQARTMRFEALAGRASGNTDVLSGLSWGRLVFQWHTLPPATVLTPVSP